MNTLIDQLSAWLLAFNLAGLVIGSTALRQFPLVGSWFRWTLAGLAAIMVLDVGAAVVGIEKSPTYYVTGRLLIRLVTAWGIWYCFLYLAYTSPAPPPAPPAARPEEPPHV